MFASWFYGVGRGYKMLAPAHISAEQAAEEAAMDAALAQQHNQQFGSQ